MFDFWFQLLLTLEIFFRSLFILCFWSWVIFVLVVWVKSLSGDYEKLERQFEEDNFRSELWEKKSLQRLKNKKVK